MPHARVNDLSMYYEDLGPRDAPALILLHGAGGSADDPVGGWTTLAPSFGHALHVYLVEHRGHGPTDNPGAVMTFEQIGDGISSVAASLDPDSLEQSAPEAAAEFGRRHDRGKPVGFWKDLLRQIVANNSANPAWTADDLRRISCPTLLIAGENDPFATAEQMLTMKHEIPSAEWLIVNNAGHAVHFELPEIVGPRILDFLDRNA